MSNSGGDGIEQQQRPRYYQQKTIGYFYHGTFSMSRSLRTRSMPRCPRASLQPLVYFADVGFGEYPRYFFQVDEINDIAVAGVDMVALGSEQILNGE